MARPGVIVLTAPSGNVGVELTRLMLAHENELPMPLRIAAFDLKEIQALCGPVGPYVHFDYDRRETWPAVLDGVKRLYLIFPLPTGRGARTRMLPFMDAAKAAGVEHIAFISVGGARGSKRVPHYPVENYLRGLNVPYTILRPCFYMQNLCRNITTHDYDIAMFDELFLAAGNGTTAWIDCRDIAEAVMNILIDPDPHRQREYHLTGSEQKNFTEVAAVFSAVTGRTIRYSRPSLLRFSVRMLRRGLPWDVVGFMCIFYSIIRFGKPEDLSDDLRLLTGKAPRSLKQFVEDYRPFWEKSAHRRKPTVPDWAGGPQKTASDYAEMTGMAQRFSVSRKT